MSLHLYVHIPFCRSRCIYCDFFSTTQEERMEEYVSALCCEIEFRAGESVAADGSQSGRVAAARDVPVTTVYFGGGTPSLLTARQLHRILDAIYRNYTISPDAELTIEANPDDVVKIGQFESFNRVSLGVQTFDDGLLNLLRRRHDGKGARAAVELLQRSGMGNISVDLIYGLPGQTMELWERDLDTVFALGVQHLSSYALSYEEGTALSRLLAEGRIREVDEELSVAMYERLCSRSAEMGFDHYEISNFALPGFHSRHNSSYWTGEPYLGFGPGAHSFDGVCTRRANLPDLEGFIGRIESFECKMNDVKCQIDSSAEGGFDTSKNGEWGMNPAVSVELLDDEALYDEAVMCGLRTSRGICLDDIRRRFGAQRLDDLLRMAAPHITAGRLELQTPLSPSYLRIAEHALMISDDIMSDLMICT